MLTPAVWKGFWRVVHSSTHLRLFFGSGGSRVVNIALSKPFFRPFHVNAEHSTYLTAFRSRASFSAVSGVIDFCLFLVSSSIVEGSSRRSIWVPTSKKVVSLDSGELSQAPPFPSHFQMRMERPLKNRLETHLFVDNSVVVICHNPLALQYQKVQGCMVLHQS